MVATVYSLACKNVFNGWDDGRLSGVGQDVVDEGKLDYNTNDCGENCKI